MKIEHQVGSAVVTVEKEHSKRNVYYTVKLPKQQPYWPDPAIEAHEFFITGPYIDNVIEALTAVRDALNGLSR